MQSLEDLGPQDKSKEKNEKRFLTSLDRDQITQVYSLLSSLLMHLLSHCYGTIHVSFI